MKVNNYEVVERHNRPSVLSKVALRAKFYNDGIPADPYEISSVAIFNESDNFSPSSILNGNVLDSDTSATVLMGFGNSATVVTDSTFDSSNYTPGTTASGIYRLDTGDYVVILDGTLSLSGEYEGTPIANQTSSTGEFLDVWTVKFVSGSDYRALINDFELFDDTFFMVTEDLSLTVKNKMINKRIKYGSKQKLQIETYVQINNPIDEAIKNIFKDSVVTNPKLRILKLNENRALPAHVEVSGYSDTSASIEVTSEDTILFNWDTSELATLPEVAAGTFGPLTGIYMVQAKFDLLDQTIVTPEFFIQVS